VEALTLRDTPDAFLTPTEVETKHAAIAIARDAQQIAIDPTHRPRVDEVTTVNVAVDKRQSPPTNFFRELLLSISLTPNSSLTTTITVLSRQHRLL
jgi:hypothetical protein